MEEQWYADSGVYTVYLLSFCSSSESSSGEGTGRGDAHPRHGAVRLDGLRGHEASGLMAALQEERYPHLPGDPRLSGESQGQTLI